MPAKKKRPGRRRPGSQPKPTRSAGPVNQSDLSHRLYDLIERIDIVLPEVTARVASLEHLLLDLNLCTREDLRRARGFVNDQESESTKR